MFVHEVQKGVALDHDRDLERDLFHEQAYDDAMRTMETRGNHVELWCKKL
jgi:hypothetical protein